MINLLIIKKSGLKTPNLYRIKKRLTSAVTVLGSEVGELSLFLTDDREMRRLNRQFRGKDKSTDVLSFPNEDEPYGDEAATLGDIAISLPTCKRQAKMIGNSHERELLFLIVHGVLHLLGYDHERSKKDADRMEDMQRKMMSAGYCK